MSHPLFELTFIEEISLSPSSNSVTDKLEKIRQYLRLIFRESLLEHKEPNEQIISLKDMSVSGTGCH